MTKKIFPFFLFLIFLLPVLWSHAQDFSNKGKDFWVAYGYHQDMMVANNQEMVLYFATEAITTVTVSIPGTGYTKTYTDIPANTVFTSAPIPKSGTQDARLKNESLAGEDKGIHITATRPVVAYAHIYNQNVSGATILFPTNTLGKEYYSVNYKNLSNNDNSNCWFYVVACDTGTTSVEITPAAKTINHAAGIPFTINLTQGQVYMVMGELTGIIPPDTYTGADLTGSKIRSVSNGTQRCKRIGVFSGSGRISISCDDRQSSSDNYMVQSLPKNAWGKKYLTSPTGGNLRNNIIRICVADPSTTVKVNSTLITQPLINNFYYELNATATPLLIEADRPVLVSQYITSQGECQNTGEGDPEVLYISPVEQNINKIIWNATENFSIRNHYINIIIPNAGTALSTFRLDGVNINPALFSIHPQNPAYSYLTQTVSSGQHVIESDSGFNAIAYGFGNVESYGYNAGTNIKDLYQYITLQNPYASINFPATCENTLFTFSITFPYQPTQIAWQFYGLLADTTLNNPVYDSTWTVDGRQLYRYKLPSFYSINATGNYPIKVTAINPFIDGCEGEQEIDYELKVYASPAADFTFANNTCIGNPVLFFDQSSTEGRAFNQCWNFGDGTAIYSSNPSHSYTTPANYKVSHYLITDIGCVSQSVEHTVNISDLPRSKFMATLPYCANTAITFNDLSTADPGSTIRKWYWNFGDGTPQIATTSSPAQHIYNSAASFSASLIVETEEGCKSQPFVYDLTINPAPTAVFNFDKACLPVAPINFHSTSTIADGTENLFKYAWHFGNGNATGSGKDTMHTYPQQGPFNVSLLVTSDKGCSDDTMITVNTIYAKPVSNFSVDAREKCEGNIFSFSDNSSVADASIIEWRWNFGDNTFSNQQHPVKMYTAPGKYPVTLIVTSSFPGKCLAVSDTTFIVVNPLPVASIILTPPFCKEQDITFANNVSVVTGVINKWIWNFGQGNDAIKSTADEFVYKYAGAGIYLVTLEVETDKGCKNAAAPKQIVVGNVPVPDFRMPESCLSDPYSQFTSTSTIGDGSQSQFNYLWSFGDPNATVSNPDTSIIKNPQHQYTATGQYNVTLQVTSDKGCSAKTSPKIFTVNGALPSADFIFSNESFSCSGKEIQLINKSSVDPGNITRLEIFWDYAADPLNKTIDENPVPGKVYKRTYTVFHSPASKNVDIRLHAWSGENCVGSKSQVLTLYAHPLLTFDPVKPVCLNAASFQLTQAKESNNQHGTGVFSGPGISPTGFFEPAKAGAGTHTIRYTFTNESDCSDYIEQSITVNPVPTADAGPSLLYMLEGEQVVLPGSTTSTGANYLWTPNAPFLLDSNKLQPVARPFEDTKYTLTVSAFNCSASDDIWVKILKALVIPNVFTPNGDGKNERWEIKNLENYPSCTVDIFNRYGQLVFHTVGYKPWDGKYNGKEVPAGTYYYIIDPKNGRKKIAGFVDIIR